MSTTEEKISYTSRRKTFHFSQKNEDLLQYLNSKDTKEQSAFIMRLIREEMEREQKGDSLSKLQDQLEKALEEINQLKTTLANQPKTEVQVQQNTIDDELINRLFMMLADVKRENNQNFEELKNKLNHVQVSESQITMMEEIQEELSPVQEEEELSREEYDDLMADIEFDLS